jgi:hypothetical protein
MIKEVYTFIQSLYVYNFKYLLFNRYYYHISYYIRKERSQILINNNKNNKDHN